MNNPLIVLDSLEYKSKIDDLYNNLQDICIPEFYYTAYEDKFTSLLRKIKFIGSFLTHIQYWLMSIVYAIKILTYNRNSIIFINPIVGIFFSALCKVLNKHNVSIAVGGFLFEPKKNQLYYKLRKHFVNFCYSEVDKIFVYGKNEVEYYNYIFPRLKGKFEYVQYGRDFKYCNPKDFPCNNSYISSGGRSNRNFDILCDAINHLNKDEKKYNCIVATSQECVTPKMAKSSLEIRSGVSINQFGSFIKKSDFFVLPLLNTNISAGHMALLEAMSYGKVIIVTDIPAIRNYVSENEVFFYKADDYLDLADKINFVSNNLNSDNVLSKALNAKLLYEREYSFIALLRRIVLNCISK